MRLTVEQEAMYQKLCDEQGMEEAEKYILALIHEQVRRDEEEDAQRMNRSTRCDHVNGAEQHVNGVSHRDNDHSKVLEPTVEAPSATPEKEIVPLVTLDEETMRTQAEACAAVLDVELPRLLQVTPRLQLFCQHPKDDLYAL